MKRYSLLVFLLLGNIMLFAQQANTKLDIQVGTGIGILGTGDVWTWAFENELNYKLNPYLTLGAGIGFAKGAFWDSEGTAYVQGNMNVFFSPLRNNHRNNIRLGTGLSLIDVDHAWIGSYRYIEDTRIEIYAFEEYTVLGINAIVDYTFALNDKLLLGLKFFTQLYQYGNINSGVMLRLGLQIP